MSKSHQTPKKAKKKSKSKVNFLQAKISKFAQNWNKTGRLIRLGIVSMVFLSLTMVLIVSVVTANYQSRTNQAESKKDDNKISKSNSSSSYNPREIDLNTRSKRAKSGSSSFSDSTVFNPVIQVDLPFEIPEVMSLSSFNSCEDLTGRVGSFYKQREDYYQEIREKRMEEFGEDRILAMPDMALESRGEMDFRNQNIASDVRTGGMGDGGDSFSTTNNQVELVDESDIVKTDGEYIFKLNQSFQGNEERTLEILRFKDNKLEKISSLPAFEEVEGKSLSYKGYDQIALFEDKLVLIGTHYGNTTKTDLKIINIQDKANPEVIQEISFDGWLEASRLTNGVLYVVSNYSHNYFGDYFREVYQSEGKIDTEKFITVLPEIEINQDKQKMLPCDQIQFFDPILVADDFINLISIDLKTADNKIQKEVVLGNSDNLYASNQNIYLSQTNYPFDHFETYQESEIVETTTIFKFNLNQGDINFQTTQSVPGRVLNQFSMDEYQDNFRVATTVSTKNPEECDFDDFDCRQRMTTNGVYILDKDLKRLSEVENLAKNESIFGVRFLQNRAFVVTFERIDPLFAIDLADPKNPQVLSELKITGFSDYLHPVSDNLLIGVGKEVDPENPGLAQGVKLSLFDVSDLKNVREISKVEIGKSGSDSEVSSDHKSFLFDTRNNLLILPIYAVQNTEDDYSYRDLADFQGSYVYKVTAENGFELQTRITHHTLENSSNSESFWDERTNQENILDEFGQVIDKQDVTTPARSTEKQTLNSDFDIRRQFYIENNLFTLSDKSVQVHSYDNWEKVAGVEF